MSLRDDIQNNFLDADGLVSSHPCLPTDVNATNNGLCYSGEYLMLLALLKQVDTQDLAWFNATLSRCEVAPGCFTRSTHNTNDYEAPDDYYGLTAGIYFNKLTQYKTILKYGFTHLGSYNNLQVGKLGFKVFLFIQPQLVAMMYWASGRQAPLPLRLYTAFIILISQLFTKSKAEGTDQWRLSYLLVKVSSENCFTCRMLSKLWWSRLHKVWGSMANIAATYYQGLNSQPHPFVNAYKEIGD